MIQGTSHSGLPQVSAPTSSGASEVVPLAVAFFAISFAFGVVARESGLDIFAAVLMSAFVYAGTAQIVALGMMISGQPAWAILLVTLLINARLSLLGTFFVESVSRWGKGARWLFAGQITDETFALLLPSRLNQTFNASRALTIQMAAYGAWVFGTLAGFAFEADSSQLHGLGLDFALAAMVLAVLVQQVRDMRAVAVALFAAAISLSAKALGVGWLAISLSALIAPILGIFLEVKCNPKKS